MKRIIAAASVLSLSMLNAFATSQDDAFQKIAHEYIEQYLRTNPEDATELGDHRFDGQLTDYSPEALAKELATQKEFRDKLSALDGSQLTGANNVDFRILKENIDYQIFKAEELKESEWNPLVYMQSLANSLYLLVARDFASPEQRTPNLRQRMEGIPRVIAQAKANLQQTQTAIYETAVPLYKKYFPNADSATLSDKHKVTAAVLDKLAEQHPDDATVVGYAKEVVGEATNFVRSHNLVTIPDTPLDVIAMPEFKRGVAIAYCDSRGPLEKNGKTFFAVAPTPKDWSKERKESFFREYNNYMIRDLTVHEAMPGHYLQLAHANEFRAPTLVRAIFRSGTFIEGWAVYTEQLMAEQGYGGPEVKMQQLKMRLRAICNAILDQSIHAGNMSEKEAMDLMTKEGYQQEGEAVAKWKRARLTCAQLSTYFVGATEHLDLRAAEQKKLGDQFNLKKYNDEVISYGSPPVKYVRELMGL